jgi:hypothetical protein
MNMPSVTIDAGVLAAPPEYGTVDDTHRYVETLLDWRKLLDEPWVAIYMSEGASEALFADGLYPLRDNLKKLFAANGIVEYDVNTVARVVDTLLQLTPSFETYFRIRDVLAEELSTNPDILRLSAGDKLQSDLARCVILIAILRQHCREPIRDHSLILRHAPKQVVNVRAIIHEIDHDRNDLSALPIHPEVFEGNVLICDDFRGLIECLDESSILVSSTDNVGLETAICIALYKSRLGRGEDPDWDDVRGLQIGLSFFETLRMSCAGQASSFPAKVLRAIVETLDGENLAAVHALRTGPGGDDPQQMRGADGAMRRDIDYESHLHYWQCDDGKVELASVVRHNDFTIPG